MTTHRQQRAIFWMAGCLLAAASILALVWWQGWLLRPHIAVETSLPADGNQHAVAQLMLHGFGRRDWGRILATLNGQPAVVHPISPDTPQVPQSALLTVVSPVLPGVQTLRITTPYLRNHAITRFIHFIPSTSDTFSDGTPDYLRLHSAEDRAAFRAWFTFIAVLLYDRGSQPLPTGVEDCAGLLRYAYREALVAHDDRWLADAKSSGLLSVMPPLGAIRQYHYPETPLGDNLFRILPGPYAAADLSNGAYAQFADARTLMQLNTFLVSRDIHTARPGDLIFYRQLGQNSPYHSMIITVGDNGGEWLVYHTGPIGHKKGEVRRMALDDLMHHPDARWRPVPQNPNFLGVYRWNILREED